MNYIKEYYDEISSGKIIAGNKIKKIYGKLVKEMDDSSLPFYFDEKKGERPIQFIETFCRQSEGQIGEPIKLELFQKAYIQALFGFLYRETGARRFNETMFLVGRKNGKTTMLSAIALYMMIADGEGGAECYSVAPLSLDTKVYTCDGIKTIGTIKENDYVFTPEGKPSRVTYLSPIVEYPTYKITFDDTTEIIATNNHPWQVEECTKPKKNETYKWVSKEVTTEGIKIKYGSRRATRIKLSKALDFPQKELPIKPYTLGVWLGDGKNNRGSICGHYADEEIRTAIKKDGYELSKYSMQNNTIYTTVLGLRTLLREKNLLDNKHIPEEYFTSSIQQRYELLKGLMDTDGTITKTGECRFGGNCKQLCYDVNKLILGLGYKSHIRKCKDKNNKDIWIISFKAYKEDGIIFKLTRKAERQIKRNSNKADYRYIVDVQKIETQKCRCIAIEDNKHLFVVGEELITTHNTKKDQAAKAFNSACNMRSQSPEIRAIVKKRRTDMYMPSTFSLFEPLSSDSNTLDGLNSHLVIIDELHAIKDRNLYEVMKQSTSSRRQPLVVMITTAGTVRECIFDDIYDYANNILDGTIKNDSFLPVLYELDKVTEWTDIKCWVKANPGLGNIKQFKYLSEQVQRAKDDSSSKKGILCKDFNIRNNTDEKWLDYETVNNEETFDIDDLRGSYAIGGADLSSVNDLTCATALVFKNKKKYVLQHYFIPEIKMEEKIREDHVPYDKWKERGLLTTCEGAMINFSDVTAWFYKLHTEYDITCSWIGYDPWGAKYWIQEMSDTGFKMEEVIQGAKTMSNPMKELEADLKDKKVNYNNNPILKWCLLNTAIKTDDNDNIRPVKGKNQKQRIDGTVSLIDAYVVLFRVMNDYLTMQGE